MGKITEKPPGVSLSVLIAASPQRIWELVSDIELGTWTTTSQIVYCEPPHRFGWAVGDPAAPDWAGSFGRQTDDRPGA
jgi:hypothetical protein